MAACVQAPSGKADEKMERRCSPILFSSLLAPFSPSDIIRQERCREADGKPGVRLLTGDHVSSPEAAFSEMPLCPGGGSREARWLRYRAGERVAVSNLPHFSSSASPHLSLLRRIREQTVDQEGCRTFSVRGGCCRLKPYAGGSLFPGAPGSHSAPGPGHGAVRRLRP